MMLANSLLKSGLAAGATFLLLACNSSEPMSSAAGEEGPAAPLALDREILAIKANETDPSRIDTRIRESLLKHGFAANLPEANPVPGNTSIGGSVATPKVSAWGFHAVKEITGRSSTYSFTHIVDVEPGEALEVTAERGQPATDPVLVAFIRQPSSNPDAHTIQVVGFNDDFGGTLNSRILWKNTTGIHQTIWLVAFGYNSTTTGTGTVTVKYQVGGQVIAFKNAPFWGKVQYYNSSTPDGTCASLNTSRITASLIAGWTDVGGQIAALAVNTQSMSGAFVALPKGKAPQSESIIFSPAIPAYAKSFVLGFEPIWNVPHVPETDGMLGSENFEFLTPVHEETFRFRVTQEDFYDCN